MNGEHSRAVHITRLLLKMCGFAGTTNIILIRAGSEQIFTLVDRGYMFYASVLEVSSLHF